MNWANTIYRWKKQWTDVCGEVAQRLPEGLDGDNQDIHLQSVIALWSHIAPRDRRLVAELTERLASVKES